MVFCSTDVVEGLHCAIEQSVYSFKQKSTGTISTADIVQSLISNGRKFIRNGSDFDKLSFDEILHTFHYGIQSRFFDYSSSTGFELVAQLLHKIRDNRGFEEKLRTATGQLNRRTDAARQFKCGARRLVNSIQFNSIQFTSICSLNVQGSAVEQFVVSTGRHCCEVHR